MQHFILRQQNPLRLAFNPVLNLLKAHSRGANRFGNFRKYPFAFCLGGFFKPVMALAIGAA